MTTSRFCRTGLRLPFFTEVVAPKHGAVDGQSRVIHQRSLTRHPDEYHRERSHLSDLLSREVPFPLEDLPVPLHHMNLAELRGMDHWVDNFTPRSLHVLQDRVFRYNCAGLSLGSLALQLGTVMYSVPGVQKILWEIQKLFRDRPERAASERTFDVLHEAFFAMLQKNANPKFQLQCYVGKVDISHYKNTRPYDEGQQAVVRFNLYDEETQTGHLVINSARFRRLKPKSFSKEAKFIFNQDAHARAAWLSEDQERTLDVHCLGHVPVRRLKVLYEQIPSELHDRIAIHFYNELDYYTPMYTVPMSEATVSEIWHEFYDDVARFEPTNSLTENREELLAELQGTIDRLEENPNKNYFADEDIVYSLRLIMAMVEPCLQEPMRSRFQDLFGRVEPQWLAYQRYSVDEDELIRHNASLVNLIRSAVTLFESEDSNTDEVYRLVKRARVLLVETRPLSLEYEEYGIFYGAEDMAA